VAEPERTEKEWALQRRLEDVFVKLTEDAARARERA